MSLVKNENNKREATLQLQNKYSHRITIARSGREAFAKKQYVLASKHYHEYLSILAERYEKADYFQLTPELFSPEQDTTEILLISHIFWDMSRIYEMTPKLSSTYNKCLNQFIRFTINQEFQVLNAEMLRKYIKKNKRKSRQIQSLEKAYSQIFVKSKKCFIATHALGNEHPVTQDLRQFKRILQTSPLGLKIIEFYYRLSSPLVDFLNNKPHLSRIFKAFSAPCLCAFSKLIKPFII